MTITPTVTVVIPTYNHAGFLREALRSLVDQTYPGWEAVVVNNYSDDDTVEVVESFADPRIRLENFRNNGIIGASRNRAIALANGAFIAFLDSDDLWLPQKLERSMAQFRPEIGLVCHDLERFGQATGTIHCGPVEKARFEPLLLEGSCITPSAAIIRTDIMRAVGGFSETPDVVTAEDYHLWLKLAVLDIGMVFIPDILGKYRVHSGSQSASALRHMNAVSRVVDEFLHHPASTVSPDGSAMRRRHALITYGAARTMQNAGAYRDAWRLLLASLRYDPLYAKSYASLALNGLAEVKALFGTSSRGAKGP